MHPESFSEKLPMNSSEVINALAFSKMIGYMEANLEQNNASNGLGNFYQKYLTKEAEFKQAFGADYEKFNIKINELFELKLCATRLNYHTQRESGTFKEALLEGAKKLEQAKHCFDFNQENIKNLSLDFHSTYILSQEPESLESKQQKASDQKPSITPEEISDQKFFTAQRELKNSTNHLNNVLFGYAHEQISVEDKLQKLFIPRFIAREAEKGWLKILQNAKEAIPATKPTEAKVSNLKTKTALTHTP